MSGGARRRAVPGRQVGRELWGIEVKASRHADARDLKGLEAFAARARKVTRQIVVFLGTRRQRIGKVEALPLEEFLAELVRKDVGERHRHNRVHRAKDAVSGLPAVTER